ncbi:MAG: type II toxin-antitoxin system RelE/ParE family toxin [Rhizobiales bacterium]|nr:type II toxin-antitoxin system RelE/ParE family toxin [Hyphomicrobiales bacterium]
MRVMEFLNHNGSSPFANWFDDLDSQAAAKVAVAVTRMEQGNLSNVKGLGGGLFEYRLAFGPGYRIYLGKDGNTIVVLLGGGTKRRQQSDIDTARLHWAEYKHRKKEH